MVYFPRCDFISDRARIIQAQQTCRIEMKSESMLKNNLEAVAVVRVRDDVHLDLTVAK